MYGFVRAKLFPGGYRYYDTPEGQDCDKKLWYITKNTTLLGICLSTMDVLMYSHPKGYLPTLGRYAYITFPVMGMGAAFVVTTCMATNYRKKDDVWNFYLGGIAIGTVMGAWKKSLKIGVYGSFFLGLASLISKERLLKDKFPYPGNRWRPRRYGNFWSVKRDFTILPDPGRTWKTSSD